MLRDHEQKLAAIIEEGLTEHAKVRAASNWNHKGLPLYIPGWPAGVLARYITIGAATVDVVYDPAPGGGLGATCTACPYEFKSYGLEIWNSDTPAAEGRKVAERLYLARDDAQDHARECRALEAPKEGDL